MFAYCLNNPLPTKDTQGNFAAWIVGGLVGGLIGGTVSALEGNGFAAGFIQGATSGAIAGAGVDLAVAVVASGGLAGVAFGAVIAFGAGAVGEIAGQQARSVATGNGLKKVDSAMRKTAGGAGIINTLSFGLGALFQYADDGFRAMRESIKKYGMLKTAFSKSFIPGKMMSVALSPAEHAIFTKEWRRLIPYGSPYSRERVIETAYQVYKDNPQLLRAALSQINRMT